MASSMLVRDLLPEQQFWQAGQWLTVDRLDPERNSSHLVRVVTREGPTLMLLDVESVEVAPRS